MKTLQLTLYAVIEECALLDSPKLFVVIARASGVNKFADETGLARDILCSALSKESKPEFATVMKVFNAMGLRLHTHPA